MEVTLEAVSKRFSRQWIFKDLHLSIPPGAHMALTGRNGAGKTTLLRIIAGAMPPSKGKVKYRLADKPLPPELIYRHLSYAAPYSRLIEEFTLAEAHRFHQKFKAFYSKASDLDGFLDILDYPYRKSDLIRNFSSGMKQRLQLGMAILTKSEFLILDEPGSNLDEEGRNWLQAILRQFSDGRTMIIASNAAEDLQICSSSLHLEKKEGSRGSILQ